MAQYEKTFSDYFDVLQRRKWQMIFSALFIMSIAVTVAFVLPSVYRSTATILIEQHAISQDLVHSTVTSYASEHIQRLSQQVMSTTNLLAIMDKFSLYQNERDLKTTDELLAELRESIELEMVSADIIDPRSGRLSHATIAFTLSFNGASPAMTQQVTDELASLYLSTNFNTRTRKEADIFLFLAQESDKLNEQLAELERQLAVFKEKNMGQLPEMVPRNMQMMQRLDREHAEVLRDIAVLEKNKIQLQVKLAQSKPNTTIVTATGKRILNSDEQLKVMKMRYFQLAATYSATHPDVLKLKRQLDLLKEEGSRNQLQSSLLLERERTKTALNLVQSKHPDVRELQQKLHDLDVKYQQAVAELNSFSDPNSLPDNPAFIQLYAADNEISSLKTKASATKRKISQYEQKLLKTPEVERIYRKLIRDYEDTLLKRKAINAKLDRVQLTEALEKASKDERFTVLDSPRLPEKPSQPNRMLILLLGLMLSVGGGVSVIATAETMDDRLQGEKAIVDIVGVNPIGVIPYIETQREIKQQRFTRFVLVTFAMGLTAGGLLYLVHVFYKPLDVIWLLIFQKMAFIPLAII